MAYYYNTVHNNSQCDYNIAFLDDNITATLTRSSFAVTQWISLIEHIHRCRLHKLVVGFDIEWRPNRRGVINPVAILQLCVGRRCLIFQIFHSDGIPHSLYSFLNNRNYTFVGVGIREDVNKLYQDYELWVACTMDLRNLAAEKLDMKDLNRAGLKRLAMVVLDTEVEKPRHITMSNWNGLYLTDAQVHYACLDAFLSFEIGRTLIRTNSR
ncbi:Werner Syndrome-like exonuclease [Telopea speciosissima]|uniref:Werner Syndrome-like exonuclease n=1 Tax=Telopea speciosissima TaxID=54955 RepID=UPI001CC5CD2C|nr:Werner Syndrome-like exonuclease [Telopea speciosissima]